MGILVAVVVAVVFDEIDFFEYDGRCALESNMISSFFSGVASDFISSSAA